MREIANNMSEMTRRERIMTATRRKRADKLPFVYYWRHSTDCQVMSGTWLGRALGHWAGQVNKNKGESLVCFHTGARFWLVK